MQNAVEKNKNMCYNVNPQIDIGTFLHKDLLIKKKLMPIISPVLFM